ncbi:MAG: DUF4160 domain-containing protein [Paludibacteraceae bacterium]|nr:DUF4160 domain-containing protein [Paludibacteraceae bacterium]
MVDYCRDKVGNCILYFTSECIVEAFHVHASHQPSKNRSTAAKFFVGEDGDTTVEQTGDLKAAEIAAIRKYIKKNHVEMHKTWKRFATTDYYNNVEQRNRVIRLIRKHFSSETVLSNELGIPVIPFNC